MGMVVLFVFLALVAIVAGLWFSSARVVRQVERGVVFRLGRAQEGIRQPGLTMLVPFVDRMTKVNVQVVTLPVPAQEGITRDNVTVRVDAVVYFRVIDPMRAAVVVQDYRFAILQVAQTSLRSILGKSELDDLLSNREKLNEGLEVMMDSPATGWGIEIDRVEIKDVALPESMKRSMSRQAEAERERRSRVITADGELQASAEAVRGRPDDECEPGGAPAAAAADHGRGGGREELHPRAPVPGRDAALLRRGRERPGLVAQCFGGEGRRPARGAGRARAGTAAEHERTRVDTDARRRPC